MLTNPTEINALHTLTLQINMYVFKLVIEKKSSHEFC